MPWIHVTAPPQDTAPAGQLNSSLWVTHCATEVAALVGLEPTDVIVLVTHADAVSSRGAVVTVTGRHRGDETERELSALLHREVGNWTGVEPERVSLMRL